MRFYTSVILRGDNILYRGYKDGKREQRKIPCQPYVFLESRKPEEATYKTINDIKVDKINFSSIHEAKEFMSNYEHVENFKIYGQSLNNFNYVWINDEFLNEVEYETTKIRIVYFDIEVASDDGFPQPHIADKEIISISIRFNDQRIALGLGDYTSTDDVKYIKCESEKHLLYTFIKAIRAIDPDVLTGWNIETFDIPYLINRCNKIIGSVETNKLSPWNVIKNRSVSRGKANGDMNVFEILGISTLDYIQLYKKFTYTNQESYKLDHIAFVELGEKKLDYSEYENLYTLYKSNHQLFIDYNIKDVNLVFRLEDKLKLIELIYAMSYSAKVNYTDTFGVVRLWDIICHNFLLDRNIVVTPKEHIKDIPYDTYGSIGSIEVESDNTSFAGAYVKIPQTGMHDWVCSFDLNSLYPHLIMQYNISPETYFGQISGRKDVDLFLNGEANEWETDLIKTPNRCIFRRDKQGFLPELMQQYYDMRTVYKKKMIDAQKKYQKEKTFELEKEISKYNNLQMAFKIMLNSAYGALGNRFFRYYQIALAEGITLAGQVSIRWIENEMNRYLNNLLKTDIDYIIASDTDSIYINMGPLVKKILPNETNKEKIVNFLDKVCNEKFEPLIDQSYQQLADYTQAYDQKMKMKRESIADKGIWTAKKRYILNVHDSEGVRYSQPKLKMMGIEAVKSSTPMSCRESIKKALKIIMSSDNESLINFVEEFKEEFMTLSFEDIAFPRGCNNITKYAQKETIFSKGTPIHVKGALCYNYLLKVLKLDKKYPIVNDGEKVKFCYLTNNKYNMTVISCPSSLPKEFDLNQHIDYHLQFEKAFLEPLNGILEKIDWQAERSSFSSLESFLA